MYILMLWQKHIASGLVCLLIDSFLAISSSFVENLKPKNKKKPSAYLTQNTSGFDETISQMQYEARY